MALPLTETADRPDDFQELQVLADPVDAAKAAGLRYVNDQMPGIRRKRVGKNFTYLSPTGAPLRGAETLNRIKKLAIPPAWNDVWISPVENGHLQATGRDARGRKQYRYHERWREVRDETKYYRVLAFGEALPRIRKKVEEDLSLPGLARDKVLATVVRLLEETLFRVGNEEYARENHSYGLTTMRNNHVEVDGPILRFRFTGKAGVQHEADVRDRRVAAIVKKLRDLPGHHLFEYLDEDGQIAAIDSHDVNEYLRKITGEDFTAKDFRTWAGTLLAAEALEEFRSFDNQTEAKHNVVRAIERVASRLGNTPAICRKCYVHPEVINAYLQGTTIETIRQRLEQELEDNLSELSPEEAAVMMLLHERLSPKR